MEMCELMISWATESRERVIIDGVWNDNCIYETLIQIVSTSNYGANPNLHILQFTTSGTNPFHSVASSLVVIWKRFPTPLVPQLPSSRLNVLASCRLSHYSLTVTVLFLCDALSDERTCLLLYMLLVLASVVFLGSESLATIFYCLRFETSIFVAFYDSQAHGGNIPTRLHTGD
jgi:DNA polymerase III epsilon subunit-like protein